MLTMTKIDDIRKAFFEEGISISEISRKQSIDRKTIRKYIAKEDFNAYSAKHGEIEPPARRFRASRAL